MTVRRRTGGPEEGPRGRARRRYSSNAVPTASLVVDGRRNATRVYERLHDVSMRSAATPQRKPRVCERAVRAAARTSFVLTSLRQPHEQLARHTASPVEKCA